MRSGGRPNTKHKTGEVVSKMPKVEFDLEAVKEIKKRKRRHHRRRVKERGKLKGRL